MRHWLGAFDTVFRHRAWNIDHQYRLGINYAKAHVLPTDQGAGVMGTKTNPGQFDCYSNALPDEPMFVLLGRDPRAPELVQLWGAKRLADIEAGTRPEADRPMVEEAFRCAELMLEWRATNDGKWRASPQGQTKEAE